MTANDKDSGATSTRPIRFQRLAEQVADDLRRRILLGDLTDGSELPVEDLLRAQYPVSKPTLREAMRVLEAEGLVTVRRGSIGGAVVHRPASSHVAYALGLVLASRNIDISDVGAALREVEPACAAACAERADRAETVVPALEALHDHSVAVVDDLVAVTTASRKFHESIVAHCGNESLAIMAGALEALWSTYESAWAHRVRDGDDVPREERLEALESHRELISLIAAGDTDAARAHAAQHLLTSQTYPQNGSAARIDPETVRSFFVARTQTAG